MAHLLGGTFVSSVISDEVYDPVFDTPMDANFIYQLLPSFYRTVMQDQELFSTLWSGTMQSISADLLNLWQIDYAKSLRDVPVLSQRKWVKFDLFLEEDFTIDPGLSTAGLATLFTYNLEGQLLEGSPLTRARWDKAFVPLKGEVDEGTSLAWEVDINIASAEVYSACLWGYFGSSSTQLSNSLTVAVLGDSGGAALADTPHAAIVHFDPDGFPAVAIDSFVLDIDKDYRFEATYTAGTGAVVLSVIEIRYQKLTGSGTIPDEFGSPFTNQFIDTSVNFDTEGIVAGDILITVGNEYEILSVDGSLLTVTPIGLPVDLDGVSYEIRGEVEVSSLSLDLPGDAANPTFTADQFGISALDSRSIESVLFSPTAEARRKTMSVATDNWRYLEPTLDVIIQSVPRLQDIITDPQELLYEGTDYSVTVNRTVAIDQATSTFRFQEPPLEPLWAEFVAYDELYIRNNFGLNVGLDDFSSDQYKARVRGLYYAYFQGPTLEAIRIGVHILIGLPIAEVAGTVESVNPAFSGILGLITVAGRDYLYPVIVGTDLQVGDEVEQFAPLCNGVEVIDYLVDPEWWLPIFYGEHHGRPTAQLHEIQKYNSFQVALDIDAFDIETLELASDFVSQIKPTWKQPFYLVFKNLIDEVTMTDDCVIVIALNLYDTPCDAFVVEYDGIQYEAEEADWKYDQGIADWDATSAAMRATSAELTGAATLANGSVDAIGLGTELWTTEIGAGAVVDKYVSVALFTTGINGETSTGSHFFIDNAYQAFEGVEPGDSIEVTGEGTFEVFSIDRNTFATGSGGFNGTTTFEDDSATWQTDGIQAGDLITLSGGFNDGLEFEVLAVPTETSLTITTPATDSTVDTGTGDFTGPTVLEDLGATFITSGVQNGDTIVVGGAGANAGQEYTVGVVLNETELTINEIATIDTGEPYSIERRESYVIERVNQLTLDGPTANDATGVSWEVTGVQKVWGQVATVNTDTDLDFSTVFGGVDGVYKLYLLDNSYKEVFYDQFEEACPDEEFTIELEYTAGAVPGITTVPAADPPTTTTFNFTTIGDIYTVTLTEPTP